MNARPYHGWLILDKPLHISSTQALMRLKRLLPKGHKIGHAGTLDPLASGVLPVALGEATKTVSYVMDEEKEYEFTVQFGARTQTGDLEGEVIATSNHRPSVAAIEAALPHFLGKIMQTPPAYSAIKQEGERAYDKARRGEVVNLPPREIVINSLNLLSNDESSAQFRTACGKGTYIRVLGEDLAKHLGTEGHITRLRRVRVGRFNIENAISLEMLQDLAHKGGAWPILSLGAVLDDIPAITLKAGDAQRVRCGQPLLVAEDQPPYAEGQLVLLLTAGVPLALARRQAGLWVTLRGFNLE